MLKKPKSQRTLTYIKPILQKETDVRLDAPLKLSSVTNFV